MSLALDLEKSNHLPDSNSPEEWERNQYEISFGEGEDPKCFSPLYKAFITWEMSMLAFVGSLGSSIMSPAQADLAVYLKISEQATVLSLSLFVLGYAFGPLIWAPISEIYGRRWSMLPAVFGLVILSVGTAVSKDPAGIFITRFIGGVFGSAPISNVSAALGDIYDARVRGVPMSFYALCVIGGPTIAPLVGAALTVNHHLGWRWTEYMEAIIAFSVFIVAVFFLPETYAPVLLRRKAQLTRNKTGDLRYWHASERSKMGLKAIVTKQLSRPLKMFFFEPMVFTIALYASLVYGLLFLALEVFPIVFREIRHLSMIVSTLPTLGLLVGVIFALIVNLVNQPLYARAVQKNNGKAVPEARLPPMIIGGCLFSIGLFWFGWTANPSIPWESPTVAAGFIGAGFNIVFQQCLNFLVDTYGQYAASAIAANNLLRCLMACGMPLAARPMFLGLGIGPASSILGGISLLALPVPFLFIKYSRVLRKRSEFAAL